MSRPGPHASGPATQVNIDDALHTFKDIYIYNSCAAKNIWLNGKHHTFFKVQKQ